MRLRTGLSGVFGQAGKKRGGKVDKGGFNIASAKADIKIESNYHCRIDTKREKQDEEKRQGNCW
jgi:hypothetical protein